MATSRLLLALALALAALVASACAPRRAPPAGRAPSVALEAPDGGVASLDTLRAGAEATVLVFWSGTCPCVRRYQERVDALLDRWPGRVRVAGVASNAGEPLEDALRVARERGVRIPIYGDAGGRLAAALGARSTPTVAVLDARGEVRFVGWLDNERLPGDPRREPWLERAVAGVLDGGEFPARTPTYGCPITRSLLAPAPGSCCTVPPEERKTP